MRTVHRLNQDELKGIKFSVRFICDRQERPGYLQPGVGHFEQPYWGFHRRDMYWITCEYAGVDLGSLSVDPSMTNPEEFSISENWCKAEPIREVMRLAKDWFYRQPEYNVQVMWAAALIRKIAEDRANNYRTKLVKPRGMRGTQ